MNKMKTFTERLNEAFEESGLDKTDLWRACGVSSGAVTQWLDGSTKKLTGKNLLMAARTLKVNPDWLESGLGAKHPTTEPRHKFLTVEHHSDVLIDHYDAVGSMGGGIILKDQAGIINQWSVSEDWIRLNLRNYTSIQNIKIVTGFGDSMLGVFNSGDPIIIDVGVRRVDYDSAYFFRVGDEGFIKRLQRVPGVGLRAISSNKEYEPWSITKDMDFEVFGVVLKTFNSVNFQ
jgi:phage repressor protein C with HTH and peptisase S24 domain